MELESPWYWATAYTTIACSPRVVLADNRGEQDSHLHEFPVPSHVARRTWVAHYAQDVPQDGRETLPVLAVQVHTSIQSDHDDGRVGYLKEMIKGVK